MKKNEKAASHYVEFIRFKTTNIISLSFLPEKFEKQCTTVAIDICTLLMIFPLCFANILFWDCKIYYFTPKINFPDKILLYLIS